tara:strand:+ start:1951 stop:4269 length:2319 start_codon:yes stop_codon:yes gene_type:complete
MKKIIIILLFLVFVIADLNAQGEKRLALVIGNANYDKGELKNPINDARLIASTLDSLNFDVILKENLATKRDMTGAIREFGSKRSEYDVAFVYYAGHGIQVDDENFLLPTKEVFEEEFDVIDYGVSVQNIMRYLRAETNEVNILILDACRDNPFESKWSATRSLKGGGLAKIPPPTGSLIAFSTDSGQTAPDGDGRNSVYTTSLSKNMLLQDTSIDQVFRNVRSEVLAKTEGNQRPVEATQLTGQTFYLKPGSFEKDFIEIDELLLDGENLDKVIEMTSSIISKQPNNYKAYSKRGHAYKILNKFDLAISDYEKSIEINPKSFGSYLYYINTKKAVRYTGLIEIYSQRGAYQNITKRDQYIKILGNLDNNNPYYYRTYSYILDSDQENESEIENYNKKLKVINEFNSIDDATILSYTNEHALFFDGFDPVFNMKTVAKEREFSWYISKSGRTSEEGVELIEKMNQFLKENSSSYVKNPWSVSAMWYWLNLLYEELKLIYPEYNKKHLEGLLENLKYDDLLLKVETFTNLILIYERQFEFEKSLKYSFQLLDLFQDKGMSDFLFTRYLDESFFLVINRQFLIHEDYLNVIQLTDKFVSLYCQKYQEDYLFVNKNDEIILNANLLKKLSPGNRYNLLKTHYLNYLSNRILDVSEFTISDALTKIKKLIDYEIELKEVGLAHNEIINFYKHPKQGADKEVYFLKFGIYNWWYNVNKIFVDNYYEYWNNDKIRYAKNLDEDLNIARKKYNVIKGVRMANENEVYNEDYLIELNQID